VFRIVNESLSSPFLDPEVKGFDGDGSDPAAFDQFVSYFLDVISQHPPSNFFSEKLPYIPGGFDNLDGATISLNASHYGEVSDYNVHSLFGFLETKATYDAMRTKLGQEQPFILYRASLFGSGQYGSHWTGDNIAKWEFLKLSIAGIMNFNMFGVPFTGSDICGFIDDTTIELCARWMQLGAFYPFARNHNQIGKIDQEPYALGPIVLTASHLSLKLRYSLLKFYYSLFIRQVH
jgi:alpha-glucosidase (family GH31 glycosyl hydrolase)